MSCMFTSMNNSRSFFQGKMITFEGPDGSGKTTQALKLNDYLKDIGVDSVYIKNPGGSKVAENIRSILLDKDNEIHDKTELMLYLAATIDLYYKSILPLLLEDKVVICDRFIDSTFAYQGYGREVLSIKKLRKIFKHLGLLDSHILPEVTIVLIPSVETISTRLAARGEDLDRLELNGVNFQAKVIAGYKTLQVERHGYYIVDGNNSIDDTFYDVVRTLTKHFNLYTRRVK